MNQPMKEKIILRVISKFLIPYILIFALYVQWHGDFGPGGGFQAGVIFAAAFILYALIFGVDNARKVAPAWLTRTLLASGLLLYAGVGVVAMMLGGDFLDYSMLAADQKSAQHLGITLIEFGVGATVSGAMITIFLIFDGRLRAEKDD